MRDAYHLIIKGVCNTNCSFCNFYETKTPINPHFHLRELKKEVNYAYKEGFQSVYIGFYGYEPTTFLFFKEILSYLKRYNFIVYLNSNGVLFSEDSFSQELHPYIDEVDITLYSSNNIEHYLYTQKKQSYKIKHKAILNLLRYGVKVNIKIMPMRSHLGSIYTMLSQIEKYTQFTTFNTKVEIAFLSPEMDQIRAKALLPNYSVFVDELRRLYNRILEGEYSKLTITIHSDIPKCITKFLKVSNTFLIVYKKTSLSATYKFSEKCSGCVYKDNSCFGINEKYLNLFGDKEIRRSTLLLNQDVLKDSDTYLLIQKARNLYK